MKNEFERLKESLIERDGKYYFIHSDKSETELTLEEFKRGKMIGAIHHIANTPFMKRFDKLYGNQFEEIDGVLQYKPTRKSENFSQLIEADICWEELEKGFNEVLRKDKSKEGLRILKDGMIIFRNIFKRDIINPDHPRKLFNEQMIKHLDLFMEELDMHDPTFAISQNKKSTKTDAPKKGKKKELFINGYSFELLCEDLHKMKPSPIGIENQWTRGTAKDIRYVIDAVAHRGYFNPDYTIYKDKLRAFKDFFQIGGKLESLEKLPKNPTFYDKVLSSIRKK